VALSRDWLSRGFQTALKQIIVNTYFIISTNVINNFTGVTLVATAVRDRVRNLHSNHNTALCLEEQVLLNYKLNSLTILPIVTDDNSNLMDIS
jgi:hypothetical protein